MRKFSKLLIILVSFVVFFYDFIILLKKGIVKALMGISSILFQPDNICFGHVVNEGRALTANLHCIKDRARLVDLGIVDPRESHLAPMIKVDKILDLIFRRRGIFLFEEEHIVYLVCLKFSTTIITQKGRKCKRGEFDVFCPNDL